MLLKMYKNQRIFQEILLTILRKDNSYNLLVLWSFLEHLYNKSMKMSFNTRLGSTTNYLA